MGTGYEHGDAIATREGVPETAIPLAQTFIENIQILSDQLLLISK